MSFILVCLLFAVCLFVCLSVRGCVCLGGWAKQGVNSGKEWRGLLVLCVHKHGREEESQGNVSESLEAIWDLIFSIRHLRLEAADSPFDTEGEIPETRGHPLWEEKRCGNAGRSKDWVMKGPSERGDPFGPVKLSLLAGTPGTHSRPLSKGTTDT